MKHHVLLLCTVIIVIHIINGQNNSNVDSILTKDILDIIHKLSNFNRLYILLCNVKDHLMLQRLLNDNYMFSTKFATSSFQDYYQKIVVVDFACEVNRQILKNQPKFNPDSIWIIFNYDIENEVEDLNLAIDCQVYFVDGSNGSYRIVAPYKINHDFREIRSHVIGHWEHGQLKRYSQLIPARNRSNLLGVPMNISYVLLNLDSLNHLDDYRENYEDTISKYNYLLTNHLTDHLNVTTRYILKRTWGYLQPEIGLFDGMIGDLQRGLAEIGGTPAFLTTDRIPLVEYIAPTTATRSKFIFKAPPLSYVANVFTLPFESHVWHAAFGLVALITVAIYVIAHYESRGHSVYENRLRPTWQDSVQVAIGAVCQQGTEVDAKSISGRIATFLSFIMLTFLYTSYSANIVALLQSTTDSIRTVEDLLNSNIELGAEDTPYARYYFPAQTEKIRKSIYTDKILNKDTGKPNFMEMRTGIGRIQTDFFAFLLEETKGYAVVNDIFQEAEKCTLKDIEFFQIIDPWIAIRKNSSYKEIIKIAFRKFHERGIQSREYRRLYVKKPQCSNKGGNFGSVGIIDCFSVLITYASGVLLAVTIFILEKITFNRCCVR